VSLALQLTIEGEEIPVAFLGGRRFSVSQRAILSYLGEHEEITPKQAGLIHYRAVDAPLHRERYASSDGCAVLVRLVRRGLVRRPSRGIYVAGWRRP
jgi:hypothetical protein